jgi:hypothetical protein
LLRFNGAIPEENVFDDDANVSVDRFIPISEVPSLLRGIEGFPEDAFPIAESPSGNFICISTGDFRVQYWDHEIEKGDKRLASSFDEFLAKLKPFDVSSIQLKPGQRKPL